MPSRKRVAMTLSVPPDMAKEYEKLAEEKGESKSQLFREMFGLYRREKLEDEFYRLQRYGAGQARNLRLTEKAIEKLVFEER